MSKSNKRFVYALCHPVSLEAFYVGSTGDLLFRFRSHLNDPGQSKRDRRVQMIKSLRRDGLLPAMVILEVTTAKQQLSAERRWTTALAAKGVGLLNTRPLKIDECDRLEAFGINARLAELSVLAAQALDATNCETNKLLAKRLHKAIAEAREVIDRT